MALKLFHKLYPNPESDKSLIILHGLFGMLDNWHQMASRFSEHFNVITVDLRNHGQSPHTDLMNFALMAEDVKVLMDDLKLESAYLLGHSMGGKTAMVFADIYPELLDKLVVVDIAPKEYTGGHEVYFNAFEQIDFSQFDRRKQADEALMQHEKNSAVRLFLLKNLSRAEKGYKLKINLSSIRSFYPDMIKAVDFQWVISTPTLFVKGDKSGYIQEDDQADILEQFPNARFVNIEAAGHWVHAENPDAFFEAVLDFLLN